MSYDDTQHGHVHYYLHLAAVVVCVVIFMVTGHAFHCFKGLILFVAAFSLYWMRVFDRGDALCIRFGPLPLFRKTIPYAKITAVNVRPLNQADLMGIHRTFSVLNHSLVAVVKLGKKTIRIGTDDAANLTLFLESKLRREPAERLDAPSGADSQRPALESGLIRAVRPV